MAQQIPVNLKIQNKGTLENDHLLPTTSAELVSETDTKQFISQYEKERYEGKQDRIGYTPVNQSGDTMHGPLILSSDRITEDRQAVTKEYVDRLIAQLVNGSPKTLDTLYELAAAIQNDPNFAGTMASIVGQKLDKTDTSMLPQPNKLLYLNADGELGTNAVSASKLKNAFSFQITGDATMDPVEIDGSGNIQGNIVIDQLSAEDVETIFNQVKGE